MGRVAPGGEAMSFINLDGELPQPVLDALRSIKAVTNLQLVSL
jgi:hypothetical protein